MTANNTSNADVLLDVDNVSLSFGGVKALENVSFNVRQKEIRAIIGPNGAGKSSMLNVINGFYHPQDGAITYKGQTRKQMRTHDAAAQGIARTFQNIALFKGMTVLDNIMLGAHPKMKSSVLSCGIYWGLAQKSEIQFREKIEDIIDFLTEEGIVN